LEFNKKGKKPNNSSSHKNQSQESISIERGLDLSTYPKAFQ
jgi:topoisomerase IA-like protein